MIVGEEDPTRPRTVFAMAVTGLLLIAGLAFLGSVTSGTLSVYVRDAPAEWKQLNVVFSDIEVHRANAGNDSGWIHLPLSSPNIDFVALGNLKMDLEKGVGVPVEDRGEVIFVHQVDILEPVEVLARRGRQEVDVVHQGPVELVGEGPAGQFLGVYADLHGEPRRHPAQVGPASTRFLSHCAAPLCPRSLSAFPRAP